MLKGMIIILSAALITAFSVNHLSSKGIALVGDWDPKKGVISAKSKEDVVIHEREIGDVQQAKALYDRGSVIFLDARSSDTFADGHIAGAVSMPVGEAERMIEAFIGKYPTDTYLVTYCSGRECDDSHHLAQLLTDYGYKKVQVMVDGFPAWQERGYPVE